MWRCQENKERDQKQKKGKERETVRNEKEKKKEKKWRVEKLKEPERGENLFLNEEENKKGRQRRNADCINEMIFSAIK